MRLLPPNPVPVRVAGLAEKRPYSCRIFSDALLADGSHDFFDGILTAGIDPGSCHNVSVPFQVSKLGLLQGRIRPARRLAKVDIGHSAPGRRLWISSDYSVALATGSAQPEKLAGRRHLAAPILPGHSAAHPALEAGDDCRRAQAATKHHRGPGG